MLEIIVLNAGKGDSIVVAHTGEDGVRSFGVIDSNARDNSGIAPAKIYLQKLGVEKLNFALLTHPHADHYTGFLDILETFDPDEIFIYPIGLLESARFKKLGEVYLPFAVHEDQEIRSGAQEFIRILNYLSKNKNKVLELTGPFSLMHVTGFSDCVFDVLLPFRRMKGQYFESIEKNDPNILSSEHPNSLSVVIKVNYAGKSVVLGSDASMVSSNDLIHWSKKHNKSVSSDALKVPHHGSKGDNNSKTRNYYLRASGAEDYTPPIALISANGTKHHPHSDVLSDLVDSGIHPYCTNISQMCSGDVSKILGDWTMSKELRKIINLYVDDTSHTHNVPCQGDVSLCIKPDGSISVSTETGNTCIFRTDLKSLFK